MDAATRANKDLFEAIRKLKGLEARSPRRHTSALEALAKIFKGEIEYLPSETTHRPQPSTNPTQPVIICTTPHVNTKRTCNNTPGILPTVQVTPLMASTPEGADVNTGYKSTTPYWYAAPREKRIRVRKELQRKSPRLNNTKDSPVEANRIEDNNFGYEDHHTDKVYGLVVPKFTHSERKEAEHTLIHIEEISAPSEAPQGTSRTNIPIFRNPRIITQKVTTAVAFDVMEAIPDWTVLTSMEME